ncbi:MAG: DUF4271 domain-containing protein [Saprospiraceae bacterium]|nr:DUF4271 domain-containing protein [Saprospiraceae bacterium]
MKAKALVFAFLITVGFANGQTSENPFDLAFRISAPAPASAVAPAGINGNPFDLSAPTQPGRKVTAKSGIAKKIIKPHRPPNPARYPGFLLGAMLVSLLLLTFFITFFRNLYGRAYQAMLNDNLLNQAYRDRQSGTGQAYMILYSLFFINGGLFLFLLLRHEKIVLPGETHFANLVYCLGAVMAVFLFKHLLLWVIGAIFPIQKEISAYSFTIMIFGIMMSMFLGPANFMIAYAPEGLTGWLINGTLCVLALFYLLRSLRGLFIANNYLVYYKFHFLLYLCVVEIVPALALVKIISNHLTGQPNF